MSAFGTKRTFHDRVPMSAFGGKADIHPAKIHSGPSIFNRANAFPAAEAIDIPLSDEALRFYKSGLPFLHDYFPFWMAALIGKLIILLIPILGVLYPMVRFLPRLYFWRTN